jgi:hypothetical protein
VVIGASGQLTLTPASGQNTSLTSGQLLLPNGAVGAPALAFGAEPTFGLYRAAGQVLRVQGASGTGLEIAIGGGYVSLAAMELQWGTSRDVAMGRVAAGQLYIGFGNAGNGQKAGLKMLSELTTIAAAAFTDTTIQIPAEAQVEFVTARVTVKPGGTDTFDYGVAGATDRYGTGISSNANTTAKGAKAGVLYYAAAVAIRYTPNVVPSDTAGRIRTTIHYRDVTPPTS